MRGAPPLRDATLATAALLGAIYAGSLRFAHLDPALFGYLAATMATAFVTVYRVSAFWRRPASTLFARVLVTALRRPRDLLRALTAAGRDLGAQRFIARRSRARWLAHLALSGGSLAACGITLPLVFGWLHFEVEGQDRYRAFLFSLPVVSFATDGALGWLIFHALALAAVAVVLGASYFLAARLRHRADAFHVAPLVLLLAVALTGLALPTAAGTGPSWLFPLTAATHEATVVVLLLALPFSKLDHVFIRPLHVGVRLVRGPEQPSACCRGCAAPMAPAPQHAGVEALLVASGFRFAGHQQLCPACRRRRLATVQADLLGAQFQPPIVPVPRNTMRPKKEAA